MPVANLTLADVFAARRRLAGRVRRTPLVPSGWLSLVSGAEVYLKLESLQLTHSFKARGAFNAALAALEKRPAADAQPLVTASAGNHGSALAHAAERCGLRLTIFTSRQAAKTKLAAIARYGADLRAIASSYDEAERLAKAFAGSEGALYISPYSHPDVVSGAGTIALEILEDLPDVDEVVVPLGGGGLLAGVAIACKAISPRIRIVGVEAEASHPFHASVAQGRIVQVTVGPTLADGLAGNLDPETITFELVRRDADELTIVSEESLAESIRGLVTHEHLVAEGAGAAGVAALLSGRIRPGPARVAIVISGANIDFDRLRQVLAG